MAPTMTTMATRSLAREPRSVRARGGRTRGAGGTGIWGGARLIVRQVAAPGGGRARAPAPAARTARWWRRSRRSRRTRSSHRHLHAALGVPGLEGDAERFVLVA